MERQNTFRPVFKELMQSNWANRQNASRLRRLLAENNLDYNFLNSTFEEGGRNALEEILKNRVADIKPEDFTELLEILDCYFDPEKKPVQPKPLPPRQRKNSKNAKSPKKSNKVNSGSEVSGNAYSDVGSPESVDTPREEAPIVPVEA